MQVTSGGGEGGGAASSPAEGLCRRRPPLPWPRPQVRQQRCKYLEEYEGKLITEKTKEINRREENKQEREMRNCTKGRMRK